VGEFGANLQLVSAAFGVAVEQRGSELRVSSIDESRTELVVSLLKELHQLVRRGHGLSTSDVEHAIRIVRADPTARLHTYFEDALAVTTDGRPIAPRSAGQRAYVDALRRHEVVFGLGPAGTGKTYLAMAAAVAALKKGTVRKLVLTRPAVEAGEKLGFLPGDLAEKVDPYLRPLHDALADMLPQDRVSRLTEKRLVEVAPLAFMRGRTLSHSFIILDEAQNTTREQMKMFLTRFGEGSRMVVTGDPTQIDLPRGRRDSGLLHALRVLSGVRDVAICELGVGDIVRHPIVASIVEAYERAEAPPAEGRRDEESG
jgi:phosphate starvation-inducible PhoH-like protein